MNIGESENILYHTAKSPNMKFTRRRSLDSLTNLQGLSLTLPKLPRMNRRSSVEEAEIPFSPSAILSPSGFGSEVKKRIKNRFRKSPDKYMLVIAERHDGGINVFAGEDGLPMREFLTHATMEYKISSYRLIMASTKAILNSDGHHSCNSSMSGEALEEVSEESDPSEGLPGYDITEPRYEIVQELLRSERIYCIHLRSILDTYAEPLRKFSSLSIDDHRILFVCVEPVLSLSATLSSKLEDTLRSWDPSSTCIANLFSNTFWKHYDEYCGAHQKTKNFVEQKRKTDETFVDFCNLRRGKSKYSLEELLYLPVQRIPEYERYLTDLLDESESSHPDLDDLKRALTKVRNMVKEHDDEFNVESRPRMDSLFPADDIQLQDKDSAQRLRSLSSRRRSAPSAVLFKTLAGYKSKSSSLWSQNNMGKKENDCQHPFKQYSNFNSTYIMEEPVELAAGLQTQDRYLFLFNDILMVAKQKSNLTFKLKHKIRVCEIWISSCIEDVSETTKPTERSFVIGWPTTNVVVTFRSIELKDIWMTILKQQISEEKIKEDNPNKINIQISNVVDKENFTLQVGCTLETRDVVKICIEHFQIPESDAKDYRLWVVSGKEDTPYALIGHEHPYAIKRSHLRDLLSKPEIPQDFDCDHNVPAEMKCEFYLKHKSPKKNLEEKSNKGIVKRKPMWSTFFKHKDKKNTGSAPKGKLFGHPLADVCPDHKVPKQIMDLLTILFREGPYTVGILRKSPNAKLCRELRERLDQGDDCIEDNCPPLVVGALLKDYLRNIPHSLMSDDLFDEWQQASEEDDVDGKLEKIKSLAEKLPSCNYMLLCHVIGVLHHIELRSSENMMTSYNLSVCIAPSLLWPKAGQDPLAAQAALIQYLIDNAPRIFGEDEINLFRYPEDQKLRQDSGTDSDSIHSILSTQDSNSILRRDDSSIDSLERECMYNSENDSSPKLKSCHHLSPTNLSRDSGLMLSDSQLNDDEPTSLDLNYIMDRDFDRIEYDSNGRSYDGKFYLHDIQNPVPPPRRKNNRSGEPKQTSPNFNLQRSKQYIHRYEKRGSALGQSMPTEAFRHYGKRMSTESLKSVEEGLEGDSEKVFQWRRLADMGTLIKSASGAHLYLEDDLRFSNIDFSQAKPGLPHQLSATDSTPPLSPESKYSVGSSQDSVLTDSSASYLNTHFGRGAVTPPHTPDSDTNVTSWVHSSQIHNSSDKRQHHSRDDSSVHLRSHAKLKISKSAGMLHAPLNNTRYVSTPALHQELETPSVATHVHNKISLRNSVPMNLDITPARPRSISYEAEDIIISPKLNRTFGSSESLARDTSEEMKLTLPTRIVSSTPSLGVFKPSSQVTPRQKPNFIQLGMSPPGRVLLNSLNSNKKENTSPQAGYDQTILSKVRRHSFDNVYDNISGQKDTTLPSKALKIKISSKRGGLNQPNQRYQTELQLSPLKINIPDGEKVDSKNLDTSVPSAMNKVVHRPSRPPSYSESLQRQFYLQQGIPLEICEQDTKVQKERSAHAKQMYQESLQQYQLSSEIKPKYLRSNHHVNLTLFANDHIIKEMEEENKNDEDCEDGVYVTLTRPEKDPQKVYMDSIMKFVEEKKGLKVAVDAKKSLKIDSKKESTFHPVSMNLHRSFSDSVDRVENIEKWRNRERSKSPSKRINTSNKTVPTIQSNKETRNPENVHHDFPPTSTQKLLNMERRDNVSSSEESLSRLSSREQSSSNNRNTSRDDSSNRDSSRNASEKKLVDGQSPLPWSVKNLRTMWDGDSSGSEPNVRHSTSSLPRPPPPPYNPPPPFRRLSDSNRLSSSSNSSLSSSGTDRSAQSSKHLSVHKFGPQSMDSFSSADSVESCGQCKTQEIDSSEELRNYTDITYV